MKVYFIHPIQGPINGVKVISSHLLNLFKKEYDTSLIDTAQAKKYSDFGKLNLNKIWSIRSLFAQINKIKKDDIVYLNLSTKGFSFYRDFLLLKFTLSKTKNVTVHIHANGLGIKSRHLFSKTINQAKIIVINKLQQKELDYYDNVYLIENALPDYYKNKFEVKVINKPIQVVFLSNLSLKKGTERLRETCEWIEKNNLRVQVKIAGGVLDKESEQLLKEIKKYPFVTYLGPINNPNDKMKLLSNSDVLLMLSDENYEVYPLVYIEALMNGCIIMTTKQIVSTKFTTNEFGYSWDENILIDLIDQLKNNIYRVKIRTMARSYYLENYTFTSYYNKIKKILFHA